MNTAFSKDELAFQAEVREFLGDYRELDGFYCQGHKWPEVRAMFRAMAEKNWLALSWPKRRTAPAAGVDCRGSGAGGIRPGHRVVASGCL